jgi:hypothetical protein
MDPTVDKCTLTLRDSEGETQRERVQEREREFKIERERRWKSTHAFHSRTEGERRLEWVVASLVRSTWCETVEFRVSFSAHVSSVKKGAEKSVPRCCAFSWWTPRRMPFSNASKLLVLVAFSLRNPAISSSFDRHATYSASSTNHPPNTRWRHPRSEHLRSCSASSPPSASVLPCFQSSTTDFSRERERESARA